MAVKGFNPFEMAQKQFDAVAGLLELNQPTRDLLRQPLREYHFGIPVRIPAQFAFAVIDPAHHVRLSANRNPHLAWSGAPDRTKSLVLTCHDRDVPSRPEDVNREGREIPSGLPRSTSSTGYWSTSGRRRRRSTTEPIRMQ